MPIPHSELVKLPMILEFDLDKQGRFAIYSSNESGVPQLYFLPITQGSKPRQITKGKDPVFSGVLSPKGDKVIYPQDRDGNEIHHLFLLSLNNEKATQITKEPYRTLGIDWHPSGKEVTRAFASMKLCGLEMFNLETGESFIFKETPKPISGVQYSNNGKWIATTIFMTYKNIQILIINKDDPSDTITYSIKEDSMEGLPSWSPSDKKLAFTSNATGKNQIVIQEFGNEDRFFLELEEEEEALEYDRVLWSSKEDKVYYAVSKHSRTAIHGHLLNGEKEPALPFPQGTVSSPKITDDGKIIVALHSSMRSPYGLYLYKMGSNFTLPLTPQKYKVDLSQLAEPQSVWYKSFDKRNIHAWYVPAVSGNPHHAAIVFVHGGPWGQVFDSWFDGIFLHSLSQNGFAVFAPNFRGSTGYGKEFRYLDIGDPGGGDLEDVVYAAEWLKKRPEIDSSKVGIMGASYGGYMTLLALTKKPEVFATGVSLVPVVDWIEMYGLSDVAFRTFMETLLGGKPTENERLYKDRSPITHVENIKAPVMIMAGKQDSRCPIQPIEKFIKKLGKLNKKYEFILEEKAGHISAFIKWEESIPIFDKIINYLKKVLA